MRRQSCCQYFCIRNRQTLNILESCLLRIHFCTISYNLNQSKTIKETTSIYFSCHFSVLKHKKLTGLFY